MNSIGGLKLIIIILIVIVIGTFIFMCGYAVGIKATGTDSFVKGWNSANQTIEKTGLFPNNQEPVYNISGKIIAINNSTIDLEANQIIANPLAKPAPTKRTITVVNNTAFVEQQQKSPEQFMKEQNEFFLTRLKNPTNSDSGTPPSLYTEKPIRSSDLKISDQITVVSDKNIKYEDQIIAQEIKKITQAGA